MKYLLSIDCGLTAGKAAVFDASGQKYSEVKTDTPLKGFYLDGEELWKRISECVRQAIEESSVDPTDIAAVGLSGHGNGLYALDEDDNIVAAVSSMYDKSQELVDNFRAGEDYDRWFAITSQSCWSGQPMQILRHMKKENRTDYDRIRTILHCKDFLRFKLTGTKGTDYSDFSTSALALGEDGKAICQMMGIEEIERALPSPLACDAIVGYVTEKASLESNLKVGTPVVAGGVDLFACMLGSGIAEEGCCSVTAGTWAITAAFANEFADSQVLTQICHFHPALCRTAVVSAPTSCVNLEWFLRNVCPQLSYDDANEAVMSFSPEDIKMVYLPYVYRDMAMPKAEGGFSGLKAGDTWRELIRAVFEGVCYGHRLHLDRMRKAGVQVDRVRLSGGASNSEAWCRLMCDILGVRLEVANEKQTGLLGAAMIAAVGAGLYSNLREACEHMSTVEKSYTPVRYAAYEEKYDKFLRLAGVVM